ncbi:MAG: hypothetical protein JWO89_2890 [Verrucomicrobiaceae bacterium]|nr:hypothetical protein [Verrucomicrobiaceae bacterium]
MVSCVHDKVQFAPNPSIPRRLAPQDLGQTKQINVFFDGTANTWEARSNVRRRFELQAQAEDPQFPCVYIEGVGVNTLAGKAFGIGMKKRVLQGYCFLARNWSKGPQDRIHIFGFSRGAFQARMLAGLMAHCGLPDATSNRISDQDLRQLAEKVWNYSVKHLPDPPERASGAKIPLSEWTQRLEANQTEIRQQRFSTGWTFNYPTIQLLGIWDTVPGLPFTELLDDGGVVTGTKQVYKVRPYPNTKVTIHALSLDEKRSQFHPIIVGPPIDPSTKVYEVWFPGAHSDVGGGYRDSNDMAGTTLSWMQQVMRSEKLVTQNHSFYGDAHGIMHHPEEDRFGSIGSHSQARTLPYGSLVDFSVFKRANSELHPEENRSKGITYAPTLQVIQPNGSTKSLKIEGHLNYEPSDARKLLQSVGLDLYYATGNLDKRPVGAPLNIQQMAVQVEAVPAPTQQKPATPPLP